MKVYGFIFARSGSKGVKNKNIINFNGKPLIGHAIDVCKKSKYIEKVIVSTDSEEIAEIAMSYGAVVPFLRPTNLATDQSPEVLSWKNIVEYYQKTDNFEVFISIPTVCPLRKVEDLDGAIKKFLEKAPELLITSTKAKKSPYFNIFKKIDDDNVVIFDKSESQNVNRQYFENKVVENTNICYISTPKRIMEINNNNIFSDFEKIMTYEVDELSAIDIDTQLDLEFSRFVSMKQNTQNLQHSIFKSLDLSDKVALVTGGAGHIGEKISEALLELGCKLIIQGISEEKNRKVVERLEQTFNTEIKYYNVDLSNMEKINEFTDDIKNKYNKIDILVNCAAACPATKGISGWSVPFEEQSTDAWNFCIDVNTRAPFLIIRNLIGMLEKSGNGSVINISSIYGVVANDFNLYEDTPMFPPSVYSVSKGGLNMLTKYLSTLYGKKNIRFNNIIQGGVFRNQPEKFVERYIKKVPLGRMGIEDDIKGLIALLSSDLSRYITGQDLALDGGFTVH
jgi:CMP-N-acetylneuraminic acid synthetase/NAD(P)-dependent dehydrogenase (short-subunit alcohol dehydrogenase family)